jgi:hypothetical protein
MLWYKYIMLHCYKSIALYKCKCIMLFLRKSITPSKYKYIMPILK